METEKIILWQVCGALLHFDASLANLWQSYQQVARHYLISAVCGNVMVKVARTLPLAAKSCELFSSSVAKDFFAVTLRQS